MQKHHLNNHILRQFFRYIFSGLIANIVDIGGFVFLHWMGMYYMWATLISGVLGFLSAFLLHKHVVFQKKDKSWTHLKRFALLGVFNIFAVAAILSLCVEVFNIPEELAKIIANGSQVAWGFLAMKLLVYI